MERLRVLFVCIHNSARSQMAEAFLNQLGKERFIAESAGLEPGVLNPMAVDAMREIGIDISLNSTKSVEDFLRQKKAFDFIITVCDEASAERCPVFPGGGTRVHWGFPDPSTFVGTKDEQLAATRVVRDAIRERILSFLAETSA